MFNGKNMNICLRHNIMLQLLKTWVISLDFVRLKLNLTNPLTKPLNEKLMEQPSRGMELLPIIEVKGDGNPTY